MRITVDPSAEATSFGWAEAGQYKLRVVKVEQKAGKKAPYLHWEFEFVDPNIKATDEKAKVGHVFENTTLSKEKNAQFALRGLIEGLGLAWGDFDLEAMPGLEFDAVLGIREYEGNFSNEIKKVIPVKK